MHNSEIGSFSFSLEPFGEWMDFIAFALFLCDPHAHSSLIAIGEHCNLFYVKV